MDLDGLRVLVVEDELLVAMEIEQILVGLGCRVVGPVPTVLQALGVIEAARVPLDGAVLDVNLSGERAYPAAAALAARAVPFLFVTGYGGLPEAPHALRGAPCLRKPFAPGQLAAALERAFATVQPVA